MGGALDPPLQDQGHPCTVSDTNQLVVSLWNMSHISFSTGMFPIVSLKKSLDNVVLEMTRREGIIRSRRPYLVGCLGYWWRMYSPSSTCAWSCIASTSCACLRPNTSGIITVKKQSHTIYVLVFIFCAYMYLNGTHLIDIHMLPSTILNYTFCQVME